MKWLRKKEKVEPAIHVHSIEIEPHQDARREVVEQTKQVNRDLQELLVENGFHIKMWAAAGGQPPRKKQTRKK